MTKFQHCWTRVLGSHTRSPHVRPLSALTSPPAPGQGSHYALSTGGRVGLPTRPLMSWKEKPHPRCGIHLFVMPPSFEALDVHNGPRFPVVKLNCFIQLSGTVA